MPARRRLASAAGTRLVVAAWATPAPTAPTASAEIAAAASFILIIASFLRSRVPVGPDGSTLIPSG